MQIWGVLNLTRDSFYSKSRVTQSEFVEKAIEFLQQGADRLDVGAESTRPFAEPVSMEKEWQRLYQPLLSLKSQIGPNEFYRRVSVDTYKPEIARRVLELGVGTINDVSGGTQVEMLQRVAESDCDYVIMHAQGNPSNMQLSPEYADVLSEVSAFLQKRVQEAKAYGIAAERLILDPGIGFGKNLEHNMALIANPGLLRIEHLRLLYGISRKSFLEKLLGLAAPEDRGEAGISVHTWLYLQGVDILRVHDIKTTAAVRVFLQSVDRFKR